MNLAETILDLIKRGGVITFRYEKQNIGKWDINQTMTISIDNVDGSRLYHQVRLDILRIALSNDNDVDKYLTYEILSRVARQDRRVTDERRTERLQRAYPRSPRLDRKEEL